MAVMAQKDVGLLNKGSRAVIQSNMDCFVRHGQCIAAKQTYVASKKEIMQVIPRKGCIKDKDLKNKYHLCGIETIHYKCQ